MQTRSSIRCGVRVIVPLFAVGCLPPSSHAQQPESSAECTEGVEPLRISYGQHTVSCGISPAGDIDTFTFEGTTGDQVRFVVLGTTNGFDPILEMLDPNLILSTVGSCSAPFNATCSFLVDITLTKSGTYTLILSDIGNNNAGNYILQLERIPPVVVPPKIVHNSTVADTIIPAPDVDFFFFEGAAGTLIRIVVAGNTNGFDPRLELLDPSGALPPLHDQFCSAPFNATCTFSVDITPPTSGTYHFIISDVGANNVGNYQVTLQCLVGDCFCLERDTNDDGVVNVLDLIEVLLCFGQPAVPNCVAEDVNGDGTVDVLDVIAVLLSFGVVCP